MAESKREFTRRCERIEELVSRVENCGDLATRAVAKELLQAVLELHGVALEHILDAVGEIPKVTPRSKRLRKTRSCQECCRCTASIPLTWRLACRWRLRVRGLI